MAPVKHNPFKKSIQKVIGDLISGQGLCTINNFQALWLWGTWCILMQKKGLWIEFEAYNSYQHAN